MIDPRFFDQVYTVPQLAERLEVEEAYVWTMIAMYRIAVPPYHHLGTVLFLRSWIEKWIADGMPAVEGMVQHRREINRLMAAALGCPPPQETIPSEYPIVGLAGDGSVLTADEFCGQGQGRPKYGCPSG